MSQESGDRLTQRKFSKLSRSSNRKSQNVNKHSDPENYKISQESVTPVQSTPLEPSATNQSQSADNEETLNTSNSFFEPCSGQGKSSVSPITKQIDSKKTQSEMSSQSDT